MANKYGSKSREVDGHKFPSLREAEYYLLYKSMLQRKQLVELELQPKYTLIPAFTNWEGKKIQPITYKPDFKLTYPGGRVVIVEVKGYRTRDYQLRRKLFEYFYRDMEFKEVH